jgi:hypothetical protein
LHSDFNKRWTQQPVAEKDLDTFIAMGRTGHYCTDLMTMYSILAAANIHKLKQDTNANPLHCWQIETQTSDFYRSSSLN